MPEEYTEEQTRAAFGALHTDMLPRFRPPGAEAAISAVRRKRRTAVTVTSAGVAAVLVAGAAFVTLSPADRAVVPPAASGKPSSRPAPPPWVQTSGPAGDLAAEAALKLGLQMDNKERRKKGLPPIIMAYAQAMTSNTGGGIGGGNNSDPKAVEFTIDVVCFGQGTVQVSFWTAPKTGHAKPKTAATSVEFPLTCSADPETVTKTIHVSAPLDLAYVNIRPDKSAIGKAAVAHQVRTP